MENNSPKRGHALLAEWANANDHWVRGLVTEVLSTEKPLADEQIDKLYDVFLREKELQDGEPVSVSTIQPSDRGQDTQHTLSLTKLDSVEHVNCLAQDQAIDFNPKLTVLFGENAVGKSGYVRILKRVASVRTEEVVLPDISKSNPGTSKASIAYHLNGKDGTVTWQGESGTYPLTLVDVFDARGTGIYVDDDLTYRYTPSELGLFRIAQEGVVAIKDRLDAHKASKEPTGNPFLNKFSRDNPLFAKIEALSSATDLASLEKLAEVSTEEENGLESLKEKVAALASTQAIEARLQVAKRERDICSGVLGTIEALEHFQFDDYATALRELASANEQQEQATKLAFEKLEVPGVLGDEWKRFIEAGENYLKNVGLESYPETEKPCIYCRQPLTDSAVDLVQKYRDLCNNANKKAVKNAEKKLHEISRPLSQLSLEILLNDLKKLNGELAVGDSPPPLQSAEQLIEQTAQLQKLTKELLPLSAVDLALLAEAKAILTSRLGVATELHTNLAKQQSERNEEHQKEFKRLKLLEARLLLRELLPAIGEYVIASKWATTAKTHLRRFPALQRSLTETAKVASETLLNQNFKDRFVEESAALRAPTVQLDFPGRDAAAARRKHLSADYKLSDILSEGEQKVIALADFLAESLLQGHATPIVFDDPVTSLDYKRLEHVVTRIVELSDVRQVVVFTHNIWFTMELLNRFEKNRNDVSYFSIGLQGNTRGFVSSGNSPRLDKFSDRKGRLNKLLQDAQGIGPGQTQDALIEKGYDDLRGVCEIVVEQDLLQNVTQRYQPNVMMTKLPSIKGDRLEKAVGTILPIFDKCCRYIAAHSQPLETLSVRPTIDELRQDWTDVKTARDEYLA